MTEANNSKSSDSHLPKPLTSRRVQSFVGTVTVPGDKSISHRALMFGGLAIGESVIHGLLEGEDVLATAGALRAMGCQISRSQDGVWHVIGVGVGGLCEPTEVLNLGNAGTAARLLMGIVATHDFTSFMTGDASLCSRPMARVMVPLQQMGAQFISRSKGRMPLAVIGTRNPMPVSYELPVASAQVKSAVLLAGLNSPGITTVIEAKNHWTRDHSENMLRHFGAELAVETDESGRRVIALRGQTTLRAAAVRVPADPSSAAFPAVAAAMVAGSTIRLIGVGMNPLRSGIFVSLEEMGVAIAYLNPRREGGEPVADIEIKGGDLRAITTPSERAPSMIDEYPILAMAAACANGTSRFQGLEELRVKESDRLAAVATGLTACGVKLEIVGDDLIIHGNGKPPKGGATVSTGLDHRIAMSFLCLGLVTSEPIAVDDARPIETSFPGFVELINGLGGNIG